MKRIVAAVIVLSSTLWCYDVGADPCGPLACTPQEEPVTCMWWPLLSPECDEQPVTLPTCVCEGDHVCTNSSYTAGLAGRQFAVTQGERPEGTCYEIPCGECFVYEPWPCLGFFDCGSAPNIHICGVGEYGKECKFYLTYTAYLTAWWCMQPYGESCCVDPT